MNKLKSLVHTDKATDMLALDVYGDVIRIAHGKELSGRLSITAFRQAEISATKEGEVAAFVSNFVKTLKSKTRKVILIAPSCSFISKNVDIPSKDPDEIRKIIELQSGRFTPHAREEIILDWFSMDTPEQHYTNVLLIIIQRKVIERLCAILEFAGLEVDRIVIGSEALSAAYDFKANSAKSDSEASGGIMIGSETSDFSITDNHQMVFARSIPLGFRQLNSDPENTYRTFIEELNKSINAYKDQGFGRPLKNLFILGLVPDFSVIERHMREQIPFITLNNVTLSYLDEASCFQIEPSASEDLKKASGTSFFDLISGLSFLNRLKVDLVPNEVKLKHQVREGGREIVTLGVMIMTIMLLFSIFLVVKIFLRKEQIKRLDKINDASFGEARSLEQNSTKTKVLKKLIKSRGKGLYVFEKINSMIGEDIYLTSFNFDIDGAIAFSGTAESMSRVFAFVNELEESNYFKEVKTKETKSRREGQKEVADFSIECIMTEVA